MVIFIDIVYDYKLKNIVFYLNIYYIKGDLMKKLEKLVRIFMVLFTIDLIFLLVIIWKGNSIGSRLTNIIMISFVFIVSLLLVGVLILSVKSMFKYLKRDKVAFIKSFSIRFLFILLINLGIDYIKLREVDIPYGLFYSIMLTVASFYLEDKYFEEIKKEI